jgi:hypothetical protein
VECFAKKNINYIFDTSIKFIIGLPVTTNIKHDLILENQHIYQNINYSVESLNSIIYGTTKRIKWDFSRKLWADIFVDQNMHMEYHNTLQSNIMDMYNR